MLQIIHPRNGTLLLPSVPGDDMFCKNTYFFTHTHIFVVAARQAENAEALLMFFPCCSMLGRHTVSGLSSPTVHYDKMSRSSHDSIHTQ